MQTSAKRPAPEDLTSMIEQVNASGTPIVVGCKGGLQAAVISMEDLELIYSLKSGAFSSGRQDHPEPTALFDQSQRLAGLGYWEWDELADECKYCSPELARLHGVSVEEYMHDSTSTQADALWVHPDDRERYSRACREFKQHGTRFDVSYRLLNPDGRVRYVKEIVNPVFGNKGDVVASFGFVQDLTEWFEKERELENAATLLQQASELANLGYWIWDEIEDKCVYCSATLAAMTETTVEEYLNDYATMSGLLKNIHPDDRQRYDDVIHDAKAREAMYEIDFRDLARDGTYRHFRERSEPVLDGNGVLVRSIGTLQDITRDKAVEQLLQDAKDDLESQVRRRTSELREANQALEISQAQLAAFFKHAPMELCIKDLDGRYVMVNPITEELYQRPADQIVGKLPHDLFSTDIAHALVAHDRAVLETGQAEIREISGEIDGEQRSYLSTKFAISNASDSPNGLGAIVLDITDQKQSEEALKSSERRYRELFEQSPLPTFEENWSAIKLIVDELSRTGVSDLLRYFKDNPDQLNKVYDLADCFDINEAALRLYRASSADQLQNDLHHAVATPVLLQGYAAAVAAFHSGASRYECEVDEVALDGTPLTTQIKFLLPDSFRDDWSRVLLTVVDLTDRKVVDDELRRSEERYRELFEDSPAAIWEEDWRPIRRMLEDLTQSGVKDLRGYFVSQRDQLRAAYGAAVILEISQAAIDLYRQESKEDIIRTSSSTRVIDQELDAFLEILLAFWAGQTEVDIDSMDTTGDDIGIIVHRRIVIPKKYRDDWSRVIYAIEDITERTRLEGYFRQAQKMEAVGQLTGGIAHDFNNLLAVVQGNAEMLIRSGSDGKPMAEAIMRAAGRGSELTQRLLAYSRQQPLAPKVIDVSELATEMLELLSRVLGETIEIATYVQPGIWHALADPGQVENAVLNLALNARDAMPDGGKLTIECTNERLDGTSASAQPDAKAGKYVVLTVSDTGCGMSAETLEHASDPFFTTKEVGQGSGLGLSMVYGFAKQSGGHLTIESSLADGTTVKLYLPSAEERRVSSAPAIVEGVPRGHGQTVLVIEDDADVRSLTARMLEDLGYMVIDVFDATQARETLEEGALIDVVLSDIVLPGGTSGPDFVRQARVAHPELKVIFMSGYAAMAGKHDDLESLSCALLNKPFKVQQLAEAIYGVLD